ncbi:MAG: hypothetical protein FWD39_05505, partial [Clostridiales bacterium]|nr:hypothetical protein [Clostridiales bacterium]
MKKKFVFILLFLVLAAGSLWAYEQYILRQDRILSNIYINGVYVGGMTKEEARQALLPSGRGFDRASITISWEKGQKTVSAAELGLQFGWEKAVDEAMESGRSGNILRRIQDRAKGKEIETQITWDEE